MGSNLEMDQTSAHCYTEYSRRQKNIFLGFHLKYKINLTSVTKTFGKTIVKEEGRTGFCKGWQDCSEGFPEGKARWKSQGAALPARGKPCPSGLFYSDLHSISNRFPYWPS